MRHTRPSDTCAELRISCPLIHLRAELVPLMAPCWCFIAQGVKHISSPEEGSQRTNNFCKNHHFLWPSYYGKSRKGKKRDPKWFSNAGQMLSEASASPQQWSGKTGSLGAVTAIPPHTWAGSPPAEIHQHSNIWYKTHRNRITFSQQNLTSQANTDFAKVSSTRGRMSTICPISAWRTEMPDGHSAAHHPRKDGGGSCVQAVPFNRAQLKLVTKGAPAICWHSHKLTQLKLARDADLWSSCTSAGKLFQREKIISETQPSPLLWGLRVAAAAPPAPTHGQGALSLHCWPHCYLH